MGLGWEEQGRFADCLGAALADAHEEGFQAARRTVLHLD